MARGRNKKKIKKRGKTKKTKKQKSRWNQMVRFHSGPGRLLGDSILCALHPAPGLAPRFPPISPLRPPDLSGQVRPSSDRLPLAASAEEGWARGPKAGRRGVRVGRDGGGGPGAGKREKARVAEKKSPAGRKVMDHAGRRHESRRFSECYSVPADWLSPAVSARTDAAPAPGRAQRRALERGGRAARCGERGAGGGEGRSWRRGAPARRPSSPSLSRGVDQVGAWALHQPLPKPESARKIPSHPSPLR